MEKEIKVWWPYNVTFKHYHDFPLAGKRAEQFIKWRNQCKGGVWELHTYEQHMEWYEKAGKFLDNLKYIEPYKHYSELTQRNNMLMNYCNSSYFDIGYSYAPYIPV